MLRPALPPCGSGMLRPALPLVRRSSPHTSSITAFRQDQFRPRRARTCREPLAHQGGDPPRPGQVGALSRQRISPPSLTMSAWSEQLHAVGTLSSQAPATRL